jgi:hypothetical protein
MADERIPKQILQENQNDTEIEVNTGKDKMSI